MTAQLQTVPKTPLTTTARARAASEGGKGVAGHTITSAGRPAMRNNDGRKQLPIKSFNKAAQHPRSVAEGGTSPISFRMLRILQGTGRLHLHRITPQVAPSARKLLPHSFNQITKHPEAQRKGNIGLMDYNARLPAL
jgi:hypothetical protein